jgi:homocysteine S-methyltransferase
VLRDLLAAGPAAIDGGLASELEARGHDLTGTLWSARLLRDDPAAIRDVHATYFSSGATVGISASYQASRSGFERHGLTPADADRLLALSVVLVREAREDAESRGATAPMLVAASVGPYGATLHDGSEYRGRYGIAHEDLVVFHRERLDVLVAAAPDLLAIETVPDLDEARAIVEALQGYDVPGWLSFSCADDATTCAGQPIEDAAALVAAAPSIDAIGINCTKPEHLSGLIARIRAAQPDLPIVVYPNAGRVWDGAASVWLGDGTDVLPDSAVSSWFDSGVSLVGGCCGLGPRAIESVVAVAARG